MCDPVSAVMAVVAVASAVSTREQGRKAASQQQDVMDQSARDRAVKPPQAQAAQAPDEQARRASQKASGPMGPATAAAGGTMLTGPGGVTNDLLNLGKNSLLGQ
jgi:hypothetical protein